MTVQRRRRASYKKAIDDILAVDATTSMPSILEQLTAMFPNISSPGFEGIQMQAWIGDQVEAYRKTHEQTSGGHPRLEKFKVEKNSRWDFDFYFSSHNAVSQNIFLSRKIFSTKSSRLKSSRLKKIPGWILIFIFHHTMQ